MGDRYTLILRECADTAKDHVSQFLGKAFSLKDTTCATISQSLPIALLDDLSVEEAAVLLLVMHGLQHAGVVLQCTTEAAEDLPKIDWPKRPPVFKREVADWVADARITVPIPNGGSVQVLDLLIAALQSSGSPSGLAYTPHEAPGGDLGAMTGARPGVTPAAAPSGTKPFTGKRLTEITPFSNTVLPSPSPAAGHGSRSRAAVKAPEGGAEASARLNELFPDDGDAAFVPDRNDITSILNKLLPDDEGPDGGAPAARTASPNSGSSSRLNDPRAGSGFSLFLAKIGDEGRREKAVPLIAELAKITKEEADVLSKKVIIPVLKGTTKDEAESAKQKFAKIGILARIKDSGEH